MKINLIGKKALVGGSSQGLGKAIAKELANCGATVTLVSRNKCKLQKVLLELPTKFQQKHQFLEVDYYKFDAYKKIIQEYFKIHTVDILINNTNGPKGGTVFDKQIDDYQQAFDLLFKSVVFTTMEAIKNMKKTGFGRIINATSLTVKEPLEQLVLSNSIRAAVATWAKTLAGQVAPFGITVNNILTGIFDTERIVELNKLRAKTQGISYREVLNSQIESIPIKRLGKPEEYGYLVSFLASEYASYITGSNIPIDGGLIKSL
ncbi:MAG: SDR family oxidoreductase [Flavobacteriaceae bacterium]